MGFRVGIVLIVVTICEFTSKSQSAKLPSNFKLCRQSSPNVNECLRSSVEEAIHLLKNGAPEIGLDTLEPLLISQLVIGAGTGPVNVQQNFKNIKLHGLTNSDVLSLTFDLENPRLLAESISPKLRLEGDYTMNGKVLLLPIAGDGPFNITLTNTKISHALYGVRYEKKGKTFMRCSNYTVNLRPEKIQFQFANLYNGNEHLGAEINKVLNENWEAVFSDVRSGYEKSFGLIFQGLANNVFSRVSFKDIFPD